jgi:hypothetical protein
LYQRRGRPHPGERPRRCLGGSQRAMSHEGRYLGLAPWGGSRVPRRDFHTPVITTLPSRFRVAWLGGATYG